MRRPIVAVTADTLLAEMKPINQKMADYAPRPLIDALGRNGFLPVILPYNDYAEAEELVGTFDALVLPGGPNPTPRFYHEDPIWSIGPTYEKRDKFEIDLIQACIKAGKPILGICRGLHFQKNHTQGKLVRVTMGEVYDVAVDCRPNSKTFGKWVGVTLSAENKKMFYIPEGFAHGFLVLSDVAEFCYKCTDVYDPTAEGGIPYDDPTVNVQWPDCGCEHKTSAKDKEHTPFAEQKFEYFEKY